MSGVLDPLNRLAANSPVLAKPNQCHFNLDSDDESPLVVVPRGDLISVWQEANYHEHWGRATPTV
jgi:hypothetical protein